MKLTTTPATPELLSMSEEEQVFLSALADEMIAMLDNTETALAQKFDAQMFDLDEGNALWSLLPAKVRTAIKRGREVPGMACAECGGAGTHTRHCSVGGRFA